MENENWGQIRKLYSEAYNMPERVVDILSVQEYLLGCASGLSSLKIADFDEKEKIYVETILFEFIGFRGWEYDLDLNPWHVYRSCYGNRDCFSKKIWDLTNLLSYGTIDLAYRICKIYDELRKEIDNGN